MPRHYDDSQQSNTVKTRRQQEDQRRMEFRRAIESYSEERRLDREIGGYDVPDNWHATASEGVRRSARQAG